MSGAEAWTFNVPGGWLRLPAGAEGGAALLDQFVDGWDLEADARQRLRTALGAVDAVASSRSDRLQWGFVPDPGTGRVEGILSVHVLRIGDGDAERYRAIARAAVDGSAQVIHRTVQDEQFDAGSGISVHDFVVDAPQGGIPDPGVERAVVTVFPDGASIGYEFALLAQNLAAFPDIVDDLTSIANTIRAVEKVA